MAVVVAVVYGARLPVPGVMVQHRHGLDAPDGAGAGHEERPHLGQLGRRHHGVAQHHRVAGSWTSQPATISRHSQLSISTSDIVFPLVCQEKFKYDMRVSPIIILGMVFYIALTFEWSLLIDFYCIT